MPVSSRTIAYFAFAGFCLLSSSRDVLSEFFFKDLAYRTDPIFVLFIYSVVTQIIAGIFIVFGSAPGETITKLFVPGVCKSVLLLNIFTLAAFSLYFIAIYSPAGAAINSFIDYGSGPVFTALVGAILMKEALDRIFAWSAATAVVGIVLLAAPRVGGSTSWWLIGAIVALLGSLSGAFYRVYFKILLNSGLSKSMIVFLRLMAITLVFGGILLVRPELFRFDILVQTALVGLFGFAIPLFLVLGAIQRLEVRSYAMLLFFLPAATYLLSAALGYGQLYVSDLAAGGLMLFGMALHESHMRRLSKSSS